MKFSLSCLGYSSALLSVGSPCVASQTSIRGREPKAVAKKANKRKFQSGTRLLSEHRRLLPMEGAFRTLIIRVTDSAGNEPLTDARRETDTWFGTHGLVFAGNQNSLNVNQNGIHHPSLLHSPKAFLYDQCSGGKMTYVPAAGNNVTDGVIEFTVGQDLDGMGVGNAGTIVRNAFNQLNIDLGIEFDAYSIILPNGVAGRGGLASQGGAHQYYAGGADRSLELVMHEFGHNLGFHHSGLPDQGDYDDNSCMMGCCAGAQQMCFNAAKSWYTGWYSEAGKEGHQDLNYFDTPGQWWRGKLVGIDDYLNDIFDEREHRVIARTPGLFTLFNRAKGVNAGVKAYLNKVVIVQQWSRGGRSNVTAVLDEETNSFTYSSQYYDFDVNFKLCTITYPPIITGPQIIGGTASQSSTTHDAVASRAIDGNLDNTWTGGSITHTEGNELDPWWKLILDSEEAVGHIRVYNRGDCCGSRLNNAFIELFDGSGGLILSRNMGTAETVKEVFLNGIYNVKEVLIRLQGDRILSLAEVQLFAPLDDPRARQPDYAEVLTYVSDRSNPVHLTCDHTMVPTASLLPSSNPTLSLQPTRYVAIPREVTLVRDDAPCILQQNPESHPDRFKCMIQPTAVSNEPGSYGNDDVALLGKDGCVIIVQPVTWAYGGNAFIFESSEDLPAINVCFSPGTSIREPNFTLNPTVASPTESPSKGPTDTPMARPTSSPTNSPTSSPTNGPTSRPTGRPKASPTSVPSEGPTYSKSSPPSSTPPPPLCNSDSNCDDFNECTTNVCLGSGTCQFVAGACSETGQVCVDKKCVIPVPLVRDASPCIFQSNPPNHPDRFKCTIQPTIVSGEPGTYGNDQVALRGSGGCLLYVRPVTWAWDGNAFIFESTQDLNAINECLSPGATISKDLEMTPAPSISPSHQSAIPGDVLLLRDASPCTFQSNPSNHPDRFKCTIHPTCTAVSNEPGTYGNEGVALRGNDGCLLVIQPVTWAWEGNEFIFESAEDLNAINECFAPGTWITE